MSRPQHCGFVSLLYSVGKKPLNLWSKHVSLDGKIRRVEDPMLRGDKVIEIMGPHQTPVPANITCPANSTDILNIKLPILVLVIKNLELIFKLEFQLIDQMKHRRLFSLTTHNYEKPQSVHANVAHIPLKLDEGWNNLEINLQNLCNDIYGSEYQAFQRIIIYPNCRLRRIYFQDRHYEQDETPVELCQAFFDMYMLKWGIHLVERSCQTEEMYTGPLQPCDLEYFATESNMSVSITTTSLSSYNDSRINQIKQIMGKNIDISMALGNGKTVVLKNNSKSANQLNKKTETMRNYKFKQSNNRPSSSMNNRNIDTMSTVHERKIKSANSCQKNKKKSEHRIKKSKDQSQIKEKLIICNSEERSLSLGEKIAMVKSFPYIEKSQYLRKEIGENFLNSNLVQDKQNLKEKSCKHEELIKLNHATENKTQEEVNGKSNSMGNTNLNFTGPSLMKSEHKCVSLPKTNCVQCSTAQMDTSIKKLNPDISNSTDLKNVETHQRKSLLSHSVRAIEEVINEVQKIRKQLNNYDANKRIPCGEMKDTSKDLPYEVPTVVDIQAAPYEEKSEKTVLSTDKAVCDFLELRHAVNKKILEKLKDKGLTLTEVELSIYNSKNRRNCYGQGKLIESGTSWTEKGSGLSSVQPLQMHASLKKDRLNLNDKICIELRNELDAALLQLKSTQVRVTTEVVRNTIENIIKDDSRGSKSDFFTVKEAEYIKKKVCNESISKCNMETLPHAGYVEKSEYPIDDFIKNLDKYSETEMVNVLFQRQMYDSEAEYRSI